MDLLIFLSFLELLDFFERHRMDDSRHEEDQADHEDQQYRVGQEDHGSFASLPSPPTQPGPTEHHLTSVLAGLIRNAH